MTRVSITAVKEDVQPAFARAMERAGCDGIIAHGARALVKPNWNGVAIAGSTSLPVVAAACQWATEQGAGEVIVGEGCVPVGKQRIEDYYSQMGYRERLRKLGVRFVNFDEDEHVIFCDQPDLPPEVGIAGLALDADVIVNLPLLKVHSCCLATLCLKNLKGCLRPQDKMEFHRVGLLPAIVALNRIVRPQINVIDAINGMEGEHNNGSLVPLNLLIAGRDPVAVDAVGCAQMGMAPEEVPLLRMAAEAGLGVHRIEDIETVGEPLIPRRFERVQERLKRLCPDLQILNDGACSACEAALMDGLYVAGGSRTVASVAMGKHSAPAPRTLVLGKCLQDYWPSHAHVKGCPPSGHAVAKALSKAGE
ncbi:MAG: hypothetical protein AUJ92_01510 [Armatimonadetes bacterium CG2_30_59_28]|nr:DUF362 domain-containing protein [Armatimonadota bacterium]OIO98362.1 MAG: hypothetical protein AUJ92_01510 [Armatimonadetes bacterium CG2_30_59_28]